ncbi:MAG: hypothetical protein ABFD79_04170 [Phycisphaerales bacterium]
MSKSNCQQINFIPPTVEEVLQYAIKLGCPDFNAVYFCEYQNQKKWRDKTGNPIRYWHSAVKRLCSSGNYIRIDEYTIRSYLLNQGIYWITETCNLRPIWALECVQENRCVNWIELVHQEYRRLRAKKTKRATDKEVKFNGANNGHGATIAELYDRFR